MNPFVIASDVRQALHQSWMIIFADLLALLLTFFVLIFSMNAIQYEDWESVVDSLSDELNPARARTSEVKQEGPESNRIYRPFAIGLDYLSAVLKEKMAEDPVLASSIINHSGDRLMISLPADVMFEGDSAELSPGGRVTVAELANLFRQVSNQVAVFGHTDPSPSGGERHPSNWEYSLERAVKVRNMINQAGYRGEVAAFGLGGSRFGDLDSGLSAETREQLARRIDIIIRENRTGG